MISCHQTLGHWIMLKVSYLYNIHVHMHASLPKFADVEPTCSSEKMDKDGQVKLKNCEGKHD